MADGGTIEVRPAGERFHTRISWLDSWHSFSFGHHHDAANTHHGLLLVCNDDVIAPGGGFDTHPHRDMEIVTWVLDGELAHRDSEGNEGVIRRDVAQRMSAGTGIRHSERNASDVSPVHLLQMWVLPDTKGIPPGYEQVDVGDLIEDDVLFPLASGRESHAAIRIHQRDATMWVARVRAGSTVSVPGAPFVHVFVARGRVALEGAGTLSAGDAARCTGTGPLSCTAEEPSEIVVWETHATLSFG